MPLYNQLLHPSVAIYSFTRPVLKQNLLNYNIDPLFPENHLWLSYFQKGLVLSVKSVKLCLVVFSYVLIYLFLMLFS